VESSDVTRRAAKYLREHLTFPGSPQPPQGGGGGKSGDGMSTTSGVLPMPPKETAPAKSAPKKSPSPSAPSIEQMKKEKHERYMDVDGLIRAEDTMKDASASVTGTIPGFRTPPLSEGQAVWGVMPIHRPPLTKKLERVRSGRGKWRSSDTGDNPRHMERWTSDQAVFARKGRARGGTILIDGSSSVHFTNAQIEMCLRVAPAATIAMYSGNSNRGMDLQGLWILASRGRRVATIPRHSGGNTVDGPALRWLGTQKGPRIWVSDAGVTGVLPNNPEGGEVQTDNLVQEAANICTTFNIRRTRFIEKAAAVLRGRERGE